MPKWIVNESDWNHTVEWVCWWISRGFWVCILTLSSIGAIPYICPNHWFQYKFWSIVDTKGIVYRMNRVLGDRRRWIERGEDHWNRNIIWVDCCRERRSLLRVRHFDKFPGPIESECFCRCSSIDHVAWRTDSVSIWEHQCRLCVWNGERWHEGGVKSGRALTASKKPSNNDSSSWDSTHVLAWKAILSITNQIQKNEAYCKLQTGKRFRTRVSSGESIRSLKHWGTFATLHINMLFYKRNTCGTALSYVNKKIMRVQ